MGVTVHACSPHQVLDRMFAALEWGVGGWVITASLDILRQMVHDPEMREAGREADLVVADGMPLVWASRIARQRPLERVAGSSLIYPLCDMAVRADRSLFFLGGSPGTAETAATVLTERCPGLRIAGCACPPFGFESDPAAVQAIRDEVREARPDIVLVCLGAPKQERLIRLLRQDLPSSWFLGLGMSLGFVAGEVRRAPPQVQALGLEWAHRLAQEPRRLARRYLVDGIPFAGRLAAASLRTRVTRRSAPRPPRQSPQAPATPDPAPDERERRPVAAA